jgi:hypothetical protein
MYVQVSLRLIRVDLRKMITTTSPSPIPQRNGTVTKYIIQSKHANFLPSDALHNEMTHSGRGGRGRDITSTAQWVPQNPFNIDPLSPYILVQLSMRGERRLRQLFQGPDQDRCWCYQQLVSDEFCLCSIISFCARAVKDTATAQHFLLLAAILEVHALSNAKRKLIILVLVRMIWLWRELQTVLDRPVFGALRSSSGTFYASSDLARLGP